VDVDCAWHFEEGVEFGRVLLVGTKKSGNSVLPIRTPVILKEDADPSIVVACHYYTPIPSEEEVLLRGQHSLKAGRLFRLGPSWWSSVTCRGRLRYSPLYLNLLSEMLDTACGLQIRFSISSNVFAWNWLYQARTRCSCFVMKCSRHVLIL
jgi:hypothetical protein